MHKLLSSAKPCPSRFDNLLNPTLSFNNNKGICQKNVIEERLLVQFPAHQNKVKMFYLQRFNNVGNSDPT